MELNNHIEEIRAQLKNGVFSDEESVRTHIVLRLLEPLKWPRFNPQIIHREYPIKKLKVDFALCFPEKKPIIYIEAKKVGNINESGEEQLFQYAFNKGVPIVLLTDGREWRFYNPRGEGDIRERLVFELDLLEDDETVCVTRLNRYLNYERIQNGKALESINDDYMYQQIQKAWDTLLIGADPSLIEIIADKTEKLSRHKPNQEQVLSFLNNLATKNDTSFINNKKNTGDTPGGTVEPSGCYFLVTFADDNTTITDKTIIGCYAKAIDKLVSDCGLMQVIQADEDYLNEKPSRKLRRISINKEDVDHPPTYKARKSEAGNYYISTYSYTNQKKEYLKEIAILLGVRLEVKYRDAVS